MKHKQLLLRALLLVLCMITLASLCACTADMEIGDNNELADRFLTCVLENDAAGAYALVQNSASKVDFDSYWPTILPIVEGATSYEMEQIGWNIRTVNGNTTRTTAYQIYFNNEKIALLRITAADGIDGIAGLHFSDITNFVNTSTRVLPYAKGVLWTLSALAIAFSIWMLVDCIRRKIKHKVLWILCIFIGLTFSVTLGASVGVNFGLGVFLRFNSIVADPAILSLKAQILLPIGAIVYFTRRKKITLIDPPAQEPTDTQDADYEAKPVLTDESKSD